MSVSPIIAKITSTNSPISVNAYSDGTISFAEFTTTTQPYLVNLARTILKLCGVAAKPYPIQICTGSSVASEDILTESGVALLTEGGLPLLTAGSNSTKVVFACPSVYFASRQTADTDHSDYEMIRNMTYSGQAL